MYRRYGTSPPKGSALGSDPNSDFQNTPYQGGKSPDRQGINTHEPQNGNSFSSQTRKNQKTDSYRFRNNSENQHRNNAGKRDDFDRRPSGQRHTHDKNTNSDKQKPSPVSPLLKLIPQSVYNPETGKVLGFLSAEDLLIGALILLLIDNQESDEDNTILIYALVYILISDKINLPF